MLTSGGEGLGATGPLWKETEPVFKPSFVTFEQLNRGAECERPVQKLVANEEET